MNCEITYEELAALAAGDLAAERSAVVEKHVSQCDRCGGRLAALREADEVLAGLSPVKPPVEAALAARQAVADVIRGGAAPEIMTLDEVAEFLRISRDELGEVVEDLPAFELAGQVRVRRQRLLEWVESRERDYGRQRSESWVARSRGSDLGRIVA